MQYIDSQNIDCKHFDSQSIILSILDNSSHYIDNNTDNIRHFDSHYIDNNTVNFRHFDSYYIDIIFFRGISQKFKKKLYPLCEHHWPKCPKSIVIIDIITIEMSKIDNIIIDIITNEVLTIDILH